MSKILFLLICLCVLQCLGASSAEKCRIAYFTDNGTAARISEFDYSVLPQLKNTCGDRIEIFKLNPNVPEDFELLLAFEAEYGITQGDLPELFTSFGAVLGSDNIGKKLSELIEKEISSGQPGPHSGFMNKIFGSDRTENFKIHITPADMKLKKPLTFYYFHKQGCRVCSRLESTLNYFSRKYPEQLKILRCNIDDEKSKVLNEALCLKYAVPDRLHLVAPSLFFGKKAVIGEKSIKGLNIVEEIVSAVKTVDDSPTPDFTIDELISAERSINNRYGKLTWAAVFSAGLVDGVNPCVFVTLVFMLSYLALLEYGKKEIILVGASFTLSVFLTYLLAGIGFLKFADYLRSIPSLSRYAYYVGAAFAGLVGFLNIYDYLKIRRGNIGDMSLKLGDGIRLKINEVVRKNIRLSHYVAGAVSIGFLVSMLELPCTGQTYLPTVLFIVGTQGAGSNALTLLTLYNTAFIIPLVIIFLLFLRGTSDAKFALWLKNHAARIKLATGIVFIAMATLLLMMRS